MKGNERGKRVGRVNVRELRDWKINACRERAGNGGGFEKKRRVLMEA